MLMDSVAFTEDLYCGEKTKLQAVTYYALKKSISMSTTTLLR